MSWITISIELNDDQTQKGFDINRLSVRGGHLV